MVVLASRAIVFGQTLDTKQAQSLLLFVDNVLASSLIHVIVCHLQPLNIALLKVNIVQGMYPTVLVLATAFTRSYLERTINNDTVKAPQVLSVHSRVNHEVDMDINTCLSEIVEDRDPSSERVILILGKDARVEQNLHEIEK